MSEGQISALFALWSAVGFLGEVPAGVLADRWSRRGCLVLASVLEAAGFALWTALPGLPAYAAGFVLWGVAGALDSGAAEALVYDGLVAAGAAGAYPRVNGWLAATELLVQLPTAAVATWLFTGGGYPLVGWVSVGVCLATAGLATRFPEPPRTAGDDPAGEPAGDPAGDPVPDEGPGDDPADDGGLRGALRSLGRRPALLLLVAAVGLVGGLGGIEEYVPVLAGAWGVPDAAVPLATVVVPLTGALGAALGRRVGRLPDGALGGLLAAAGLLLGAAAVWARPPALVAVALCYGLYLAVLVVAEARLQERIDGRYRATLTSVSALGVELASLAVFAAWAVHGALAVAVLVLAVVPVLVLALRTRRRPR